MGFSRQEDLIDRVPDELWNEVCDIVQETGIETIPMEKKCKKEKRKKKKKQKNKKRLSGTTLQTAVKKKKKKREKCKANEKRKDINI